MVELKLKQNKLINQIKEVELSKKQIELEQIKKELLPIEDIKDYFDKRCLPLSHQLGQLPQQLHSLYPTIPIEAIEYLDRKINEMKENMQR